MKKMGRPPKDDAKKISINIRCTEEQKQKLKAAANNENITLSDYVLKCCKVIE